MLIYDAVRDTILMIGEAQSNHRQYTFQPVGLCDFQMKL